MKIKLILFTLFFVAMQGNISAHVNPDRIVSAVDSLELCPDFITVTPVGDCGSFLFNLNNIGDFGNMIWNWGDGGTNSGANNVGHTYFEPGEYTVCVQAWTGVCPDGVEVCTTVLVPDCEFECPEAIVATELECGLWSFALYPGNAVIGGSWVFGDGQVANAEGNTVTHEFSESGEYTVEVNSSLNQPCFNNYFTTTIDVVVCVEECGLEVEIIAQEGNTIVMQATDFPEGAQIHWEVNGSIVAIDSVATLELQPGENEICVNYETPECPQGVFWCDTITISEEDDCPYELVVEESEDCGCYDFAISPPGAGSQYMWNMGDTTYLTFSHNTTYCFESGFQTMYVQIMGSNYPDCESAPFVHEWEVPECDNPCGLEVEFFSQTGNLLVLLATDYPGNAQVHWELNGSFVNIGSITTFDLTPGANEICAYYETPECPQGVFWCDTFFGENPACPAELSVLEEEECGCYMFSINPPNLGSSYFWNLGDSVFTSSAHTVSYCFEPGFHTMYVQIMGSDNPDCEGAPLVHQWEVPDCENLCGLEVDIISQAGNLLVMLATDYPDNAQVHWELNGEIVNIGNITAFELESGENEICVYYETPECPQGVFWCETFSYSDSDECPFELIVEETEDCGCYSFAVSEPYAGSLYVWKLGDTVLTSLTPFLTHCFEPGLQSAYVMISGSEYPDCMSNPPGYFWEVPECDDPDCFWFAFQIATNIAGVSFGLDWSFSELNGEQVGGGTIQIEGDNTVYSGEVCIGVGCYILEFTAPFPISIENFDIEFLSVIDPIIPVSIEWVQDSNPYTIHSQIGIAATCIWPVGVEDYALDKTQVFPVPANDILNIQLGEEIQTNLRLYNVSGQLVLEKSIQQSGPIDVSALPAGLYLLQIQQGNDFKTFSIPLLN